MSLAASADGRSLALATQYQIQRFDNVLPPGETTPDGRDALDAPHATRVTGDLEARCGLAVFDLATGDMIHWVRIEGVVRELYDVAFLPGARRPAVTGFKTDEVKRVVSIET